MPKAGSAPDQEAERWSDSSDDNESVGSVSVDSDRSTPPPVVSTPKKEKKHLKKGTQSPAKKTAGKATKAKPPKAPTEAPAPTPAAAPAKTPKEPPAPKAALFAKSKMDESGGRDLTPEEEAGQFVEYVETATRDSANKLLLKGASTKSAAKGDVTKFSGYTGQPLLSARAGKLVRTKLEQLSTPHGRLADAAALFNKSGTGYTATVTLVLNSKQGH